MTNEFIEIKKIRYFSTYSELHIARNNREMSNMFVRAKDSSDYAICYINKFKTYLIPWGELKNVCE